MTVASEENRSGPYIGNGSATVFNYDFRILDEAHIRVVHADANGIETELTLGADYSVSGVGLSGGGSITMTTAPAVGQKITILRNAPFTQETDLENQGAYFAETIEAALDLSAMRDQQLSERIDRAILIPASTPDYDPDQLINDVINVSLNRTATEVARDQAAASASALGNQAHQYDTRTLAAAAIIPAGVNVIRTHGLTTAGDGGGATYIKGTNGSPGAFQDAGGQYWGLVKTRRDLVPTYDTATALAADTAATSDQTIIRTRGKLAIGDYGGATYVQVASDPAQPGAFQLASGRWVKLLEPIVTPEMFQLSTDAGNDALMWARLFDYVNTVGAEGAVASHKTYTFATSCAITVPLLWRTKVRAHGAIFTTNGAIWQFTVTGGGYSGGMDLEGFSFDHQNKNAVLGAFKLARAGCVRIIKPVIKAGQTTNANYIGIYITESTPGNSSTGSFWNVVQDPQIFTTTADLVPFGVLFDGAANQCRVIGGLINGNLRSVSIYPGTSPNFYSSNNIVIDGVSFESGSYGVYFNGVLGNANTAPDGLKIINCRFESMSQAGVIFVNANQQAPFAAPELHGNMFVGTPTPISNPNNIRINSTDRPQDLSGTVSFSGNTQRTVTFPVNQPSTNYVVALDIPANQLFWVSSKAVGSFNINTTAAFTGTVGWTLTRLS